MSLQQCAACGESVAAYYLSAGLCDECKWETWIPRGYEIREKYVFSEVWRHANATYRPPMGAEFLDRKPFNTSELLLMCSRRPRSGSRVARGDTSKKCG